jgi:hypothetical protein
MDEAFIAKYGVSVTEYLSLKHYGA